MSDDKSFTYKDVADHSSKKDLQLVVHDKVYDATSFVDEHPGGEEVLLDVGGQDATEAFEDVGHSDEAREILEGLKIGDLKRMPEDPEPKTTAAPSAPTSDSSSGGNGFVMYGLVMAGIVLAVGAYQYMQAQKDS
ncbi:MAG: hypothetical protein M1831_001449 [Alyxoria varia]|nr:MAG: hypothetical protein M1831_001449 [Alyxoria varia]